jgi:CTP:molybdopterin cytidylyltransferase MocA
MPVAAILLAAGASRRLGRPKQLLVFEGETLLDRAVRLAAEAGSSPVIAVLGAHFLEIPAAIPQHDSIRVINDKWEQGIATSIQAGLHALSAIAPKAPGVLLMTCDQPRLTAMHLRRLIKAFKAGDCHGIAASAYAGSLGVPAVFTCEVFSWLHKLKGDEGARKVLLRPPCPLVKIDFPGGEVDIDEPADLAQLE